MAKIINRLIETSLYTVHTNLKVKFQWLKWHLVDETIFLFDMFVITYSSFKCFCFRPATSRSSRSRLPRRGTEKSLTINKSFTWRSCQNKTSQTSSILLEATGKVHWQTSNRKMMSDTSFSADPCAAHQSSLFSMENSFHRKVTHRVLQDMLENCIVIFTTAFCNMLLLWIFSSNTSAESTEIV